MTPTTWTEAMATIFFILLYEALFFYLCLNLRRHLDDFLLICTLERVFQLLDIL